MEEMLCESSRMVWEELSMEDPRNGPRLPRERVLGRRKMKAHPPKVAWTVSSAPEWQCSRVAVLQSGSEQGGE